MRMIWKKSQAVHDIVVLIVVAGLENEDILEALKLLLFIQVTGTRTTSQCI